MGFITHIPGTKPLVPQARHPRSKGLGVLGLHEGRTLLLALGRASRVHAVAGCDLSEEKIEASRRESPDLFYTREYALLARRVEIVAIYTPDSGTGARRPGLEAGKNVICTSRW